MALATCMNDPAAQPFGEVGAVIAVLALIFLVVLTVLWILLPFAVFGIKNRLDELNDLVRAMGRQLEETNNQLDFQSKVLNRLLGEIDPGSTGNTAKPGKSKE